VHAIAVTNVSKRFRFPAIPKQMTLKEAVIKRLVRGSDGRRTVDALSDVSFTLEHGQMLGVVGRNGSGKSTLLRLLAGIFRPTDGAIVIDGSLAPLLALGAGFHPDLTGRENARIEMLVLGFTPAQVNNRMGEVVAFSELGDFIDAPMRAYSSGMWMRLAFSVAISVDPDVLLLDEVLSVGDEAFSAKCLSRIDEFRAKGKTIVLVTHATQTVVERCDVALWLDQGRVAAFGDPVAVTQAYHALPVA
jgi:lipopolysaccharide transport system ATP-binding protein